MTIIFSSCRKSGTVFLVQQLSIMYLIGYMASTVRTYCDVLFIQDFDCLYFIIVPKLPKKLTAANQISANRIQLTFIIIAENTVVPYADKSFRRNVHKKTAYKLNTIQRKSFPCTTPFIVFFYGTFTSE